MTNLPTPLYYIIGACAFAMILGSFFWGGIDFGGGTLIGSLVIAANFLLLKKVFQNIFTGEKPKFVWIFIYVFKLAATFGIIYFANKHFGLSIYGIALGLSLIVISIFAYIIYYIVN